MRRNAHGKAGGSVKDPNKIKQGMQVTVTHLGSTVGMLIAERHLRVRRTGATGEVISYVPGHGGDVWFIDQGDGDAGAYCYTEFEPKEEPPMCPPVVKVG